MDDKKNSALTDAQRISELECELRDAQIKLDHIVGSIFGGIAVYKFADGRFITEYYTEGVPALTGHTREEYAAIIADDAMDIVYPVDRPRVAAFAADAMRDRRDASIAYRIMHKNGDSVWVHLSMRFIAGAPDEVRFYAVFTGMSPETKLFQTIANDSADGIYVIDKNNFDLYYANESVDLFVDADANAVGKKCYAALHGRSEQCEFCPLRKAKADGVSHIVEIPESGRVYDFRFRETDWYGIPAFVKYVSDITEEMVVRRQKEKLEQYFRMMVNNLSGGVAVCLYDEKSDTLIPEFLSDGFAAMCGMTHGEAWELYRGDASRGVHPDDLAMVKNVFAAKIYAKTDDSFEIIYRLRKKDGSYFWVKNTNSLIYSDGQSRTYSVYSDVSNEVAEQERTRSFYREMLYRHHRSNDPNMLIAAHCNVSQRYIVRITDKNGRDLDEISGMDRDEFFGKISLYIENEQERKTFREAFMTENLLESFAGGTMKREIDCFMRFPETKNVRYVRVTVNLVESPETGDIMGMLTAVDHTERRVSDLIMHSIIRNDYDFISVLDLATGEYDMLSYNEDVHAMPDRRGSFSAWVAQFLDKIVAPKDKAECSEKLSVEYIRRTLDRRKSFSFHYSVTDENGRSYDKNMVVFYIDKRLDKVCLARTDITASVMEQRRLLNALAYAFELVSFVDVASGRLTVHTRKTLLGKLPPCSYRNIDEQAKSFAAKYVSEEAKAEISKQMSLATVLSRLKEAPQGYEFSFPCYSDDREDKDADEVRFKQVSVMWGDEYRRTVCMIRADVTDSVRKERETREHLRSALMIANEANRAKTDFLSSMSHDIRTPMNAIVGMTELALADRDNPAQIDESLAVIKSSSDHLLRLINEILDMSRIESGRLSLVKETFSHKEEFGIFISRTAAMAEKKNIALKSYCRVEHDTCVGDIVRLHQVMDNLAGNAIKFTPEGGTVTIGVEELPPKSEKIGFYRYVVADSGVGMDEEAIKHIFEPFYRSENSFVRRTEGTGLGLSIVKSIVDYKGGTIKVESEPGKGSRFIVEIPLHFAAAAAAAPKKEKEYDDVSLIGTHVLLVEDNPLNCLVAVKMLERAGVTADTAEDGAQGVAMFESSAPGFYAAILMDIQMPVMDGLAATRTIRAAAHPQSKSIPIIAMTANAFNSDVKHCLDAGMNAHISKPIAPEKLYRILRTFAGGGRQI